MPNKSLVKNQDVVRATGLSPSGISRIRSGERHPHLNTMKKIQEAYGWSAVEQWKLIAFGPQDAYRQELERVLTDHVIKELQEDRQK